MPNDHADISPSSLNYRAQCRQWTKSESSDPKYAEEGTLLHAALEHDDPTALDGEQLRVYDTLQAFLAPLQAGAEKVLREQRLDIKLGKHATFGTCDRIVIRPAGLAHVIDFKFGRLSVPDADSNLQALAYAIGVFDAFPKVSRIQAWMLSPRRDEASSVVLDRRDLATYRAKLEKLFDELADPRKPATPGDACAYCGQLGHCPAVAKTAGIVALNYDTALAEMLPADFHASRLSTEDIGNYALPVARVLEKWVSAVKAEALDRASAGDTVPGHVVAERAKSQTLTNLKAVNAALVGLVPLTAVEEAATISLSDVKSIARTFADKGKAAEAEREVVRRLSAAGLCSEQPESIRYIKRK